MRLRYRYVTYGVGPGTIDQMQHMHQLMYQMIVRATPGSGGAWQPPADVYEGEDSVVVQVELAGVKEDDIDITLFADHLAVSGVRQSRVPAERAAYHLAGILYGQFRVEVPIVATIQREAVEASCEDGMLTIVLPKTSRPEPAAISIRPTASGSRDDD